jgi:hypothetical protein
MPLHPSILEAPRKYTPQEKARQMMSTSPIDDMINKERNKPYWEVPISISKRDMQISVVQVIIRSKDLPKDDKKWWKEVLAELGKFPR